MITVTVMRPNMVRLPALAAAAFAAAAFGLAGAGGSAGCAPVRPSVVHVVAAENFWGNITSQLGGRDVKVTSLITNPNADPHLFETDAADAATLAQAQVVIENGAGYDTWMSSLLSADGGSPRIVNAANVLHVTGSDPNPHLWYDIPRVPAVAAAIAAALQEGGAAGRGDVQGQPRQRSTRRWPRSTRRWPPSRRASTTCRSPTPSGYPATRWPWPASTS